MPQALHPLRTIQGIGLKVSDEFTVTLCAIQSAEPRNRQ
jgi:hypothetical protein